MPSNFINNESAKKSEATLVRDYISDQNQTRQMKEINLKTPHGSNKSIPDEKSSLIGAQNDLRPKYSGSTHGAKQQHGLTFKRTHQMTQTLQMKKRPMQVNHIGLIKKKYVSQINEGAINETQQQEFIIDDSQIGIKTNTKDRTRNGEDDLDYDHKVGLFASGVQLASEGSDAVYEITNIKTGSHPELEYKSVVND